MTHVSLVHSFTKNTFSLAREPYQRVLFCFDLLEDPLLKSFNNQDQTNLKIKSLKKNLVAWRTIDITHACSNTRSFEKSVIRSCRALWNTIVPILKIGKSSHTSPPITNKRVLKKQHLCFVPTGFQKNIIFQNLQKTLGTSQAKIDFISENRS